MNGECNVQVDKDNKRIQTCNCKNGFVGDLCEISTEQMRIDNNKACMGDQC